MFGKMCQSCGMPLSKDKNGGGTNADGTKSTEYCSNCYQNGHFTLPHITLDEMKTRVQGKMHEMHLPGFVAKFLTRNLHTLKRWNNS
jgi:hypothetical protein